MAHAQWAVLVRSLDADRVLYQRNPGTLMIPASNMKIVTLAGAARVLGWDARFATTLETTAPVHDGVLQGDLVVRGGGDPSISRRDGRGAAVFAEWIAALHRAGITGIDGRIVGDDQAFDDEGLGSGWSWDDLQFGYAAPAGALQYDESVATLSVVPGSRIGDPAIAVLAPGSGLTVWNRATTGPADAPETVEYRRHLDRPVLEVTGVVPLPAHADDPSRPAPARSVQHDVAVVNPTVHFAQALKDALTAAGIRVTGEAVDFDDVAATLMGRPEVERRVLARSESPPLRDLAAVLMKVSQNLYAETLLKAVGAARGGLGTTAAGRAAVAAALGDWDIDTAHLVMADGSGLSRYNYLTAELLVGILQRMHRDEEHRQPFAAALPVAGREGTISARMRRSLAEGNARAKTGSLSNVRALSGYVRTRGGELLAFSILANDFVVPAATVNWIVDLAVEVLASFSGGS